MGHPLLPSQAVHDPIAKLVAAAGTHVRRLEGAVGGAGGGCLAGVQANLARLLGEIWRKLREESALLDFFLRADGEDDLRLDVFDRLLPLLELRGRAGQQAQEACLVALSVKDARVGRYVRDRTGLAAQLAGTLTARYMALYDTLEELQVAAALPPPVGAGKDEDGAGGIAGLLTQQQPERAEATFTEALTLFLQHLRFCNAVGLVAADTQACLRPPAVLMISSPGGGSSGGSVGIETAAQTGIAPAAASLSSLGVHSSLNETVGFCSFFEFCPNTYAFSSPRPGSLKFENRVYFEHGFSSFVESVPSWINPPRLKIETFRDRC